MPKVSRTVCGGSLSRSNRRANRRMASAEAAVALRPYDPEEYQTTECHRTSHAVSNPPSWEDLFNVWNTYHSLSGTWHVDHDTDDNTPLKNWLAAEESNFRYYLAGYHTRTEQNIEKTRESDSSPEHPTSAIQWRRIQKLAHHVAEILKEWMLKVSREHDDLNLTMMHQDAREGDDDGNWDEMYSMLVQQMQTAGKLEFGADGTNFPPKLTRWIRAQARQYQVSKLVGDQLTITISPATESMKEDETNGTFFLSREKTAKLLALGISLDDPSVALAPDDPSIKPCDVEVKNESVGGRQNAWMTMYRALERYVVQHGNANVPKTYKEDRKLANFVSTQRKEYKKFKEGKTRSYLTQGRIELLNAIGFEWSRAGIDSWNEMYERLKEYKRKNGNCRVPKTSKDDPKLANFVATQRKHYKVYQQLHSGEVEETLLDGDGKPTTERRAQTGARKAGCMREERIKLLNDIGFDWELVRGVKMASWSSMLDRLVEYKESHGNTRVPKSFPDAKLAQWVKSQRREYKRFLQEKEEDVAEGKDVVSSCRHPKAGITMERIEALRAIGFEWDVQESSWQSRFEELRQYINGSHSSPSFVPKSIPDNPRLSNWCSTQRSEYRKKQRGKTHSLTDERQAALEAIGFEWTKPSLWDENIEKLKQYLEDHNGALPTKSKYSGEDMKLATWLSTQRKEYNRFQEGTHSYLSEERINTLNQLGALGPSWEDWFDRLRMFKDDHGHCNVPSSYIPDPKLSKWTQAQRQAYIKYANGRPSHLTNERVATLDALNFEWNSIPEEVRTKAAKKGDEWMAMYNRLRTFFEANGHSNVPQPYDSDPKLSRFVKRLRDSSLKLPPSQKSLLDEIDFQFGRGPQWKWSSWDESFERLKAYATKYGDCHVPHNFAEDKKLANWCITQRRMYRKLQAGEQTYITQEQVERLTDLGFRWGKQNPSPSWDTMFDRLVLYRQQKGNTRVPRTYKEDSKLGQWVRRQRREYRKQRKGQKGCISDERVHRLENLGFDWDLTSQMASPGGEVSHISGVGTSKQIEDDDEDDDHKIEEVVMESLAQYEAAAADGNDDDDVAARVAVDAAVYSSREIHVHAGDESVSVTV